MISSLQQKTIIRILLSFSFVFFLLLTGCTDEKNPSYNSDVIFVDCNGQGDFTSIQEAINASSNNEIINVSSGIYIEHIVINKSVKLFGESMKDTIINGVNQGDVISVTENGSVQITGFTIKNSGENRRFPFNAGIKINSNDNLITGNKIMDNSNGIVSYLGSNNMFSQNYFSNNSKYGIMLYSEEKDYVTNNSFNNNQYGLYVKGSQFSIIEYNVFQQNNIGLSFCCGATNNNAYLNNFINNTESHVYDEYKLQNTWTHSENGGNYWDNYTGTDANNDGIGDTPYLIREEEDDEPIKDSAPLMEPVPLLDNTKS